MYSGEATTDRTVERMVDFELNDYINSRMINSGGSLMMKLLIV